MTPTLLGRWQTRILLTLTVGVILTLPFWWFINVDAFTILFSLLFWGLLWDCLYTLMQKFRWDRDWPAAYQVAAGVWEAFFLLLLISTVGLFGIFIDDGFFSLFWFVVHYSTVWLGMFLASQVLMRLFFPQWRFRGGRWL
ncbi:MAG: hypothetical protein AAFV85_00875 [Cyanobacteria bacterium J06634_6]